VTEVEDKEIVIVLPLKTWRTVVAHLESGIARDVNPILKLMGVQADPQIALAQKEAAERAAAETAHAEQALLRAMEVAEVAAKAAAEDPADTQSISQPTALH
jgi:hypothetical protein